MPCQGGHEHEPCLGGNARPAQEYTPALAQAFVRGLIASLTDDGDERWCLGQASTSSSSWIADMSHTCDDLHKVPRDHWHQEWQPPGDDGDDNLLFDKAEVLFLDVTRQEHSWRPLLAEVQDKLEGRTTPSFLVLPKSDLHDKIQALVPWKLIRVQLFRAPKQRRLPDEVLRDGATHRMAALLHNDGSMRIEAEAVAAVITAPSSRFSTPVRVAVFAYGQAPSTSLNEADDRLPENSAPAAPARAEAEPEDVLQPWQPGFRSMRFDIRVPPLTQQMLRRVHVNLGHPANETLIRMLVSANASKDVLHAAKHLVCDVCLRNRPLPHARPTGPSQPRRFNDRVGADLIFLRDIKRTMYCFLNLVDYASAYQMLDLLPDRSEAAVIRSIINSWGRVFGFPDELALDAEGCFRSYRFEQLAAQTSTKVRFVPAEAHYQLGMVERHGHAAKMMARRLIDQFAPTDRDSMILITTMVTHAKNSQIRRSGVSPCQFVFGRNPRLPSGLLSSPDSAETHDLISHSEQLRQVEEVRYEAMRQHWHYENSQRLRAAMLRKSRPFRGPFSVGQPVAFWRDKLPGGAPGYKQGTIIAMDPPDANRAAGSVWVRTDRGQLTLCSREQLRALGGEDWSPSAEDLQHLKDAEKELGDDDVWAYENKSPAPTATTDQLEESKLDASGNPMTRSAEALGMDPLMMVPPTPLHLPSTPRPDTVRRRRLPREEHPGFHFLRFLKENLPRRNQYKQRSPDVHPLQT